MIPILGALATRISPRIIMVSAIALSAAAVSWRVTASHYQGRIHAIQDSAQAAYNVALAQARELTDLNNELTSAAGELEAARIEQHNIKTRTITKEVIKYVQSNYSGNCDLPAGWVRIHNAAATGRVPTAASATAVPDGAPSGVSDSDAIQAIANNYGTCNDVRGRLEALQSWVRSRR